MPENIERLSEVGPLDPRTGYPLWYEDSTGVRLELVWEQDDGEARVILALEATFGGNEEIRDGQQIVFGRIRFRIKDGRIVEKQAIRKQRPTLPAK